MITLENAVLRNERGLAKWDVIPIVLVVLLVSFLLVTMGIRTAAADLENECQERLLALAQAQQLYLVKHGEFASELPPLRPFLEEGERRMPFICPITENPLQIMVQGDRYMIVAPGSGYSILTGDPSW